MYFEKITIVYKNSCTKRNIDMINRDQKIENIYKVKTSETNLHCEVLSCIIYTRLKEISLSFPASLLQRKLKAFSQPILLPQRESSNRLYDQLNVARFPETQIINILR